MAEHDPRSCPLPIQGIGLGVVGGEVVTNVSRAPLASHPARLAAADRAAPPPLLLMRTSASQASQEFSCVMKSRGDERRARCSGELS